MDTTNSQADRLASTSKRGSKQGSWVRKQGWGGGGGGVQTLHWNIRLLLSASCNPLPCMFFTYTDSLDPVRILTPDLLTDPRRSGLPPLALPLELSVKDRPGPAVATRSPAAPPLISGSGGGELRSDENELMSDLTFLMSDLTFLALFDALLRKVSAMDLTLVVSNNASPTVSETGLQP